MTIFELCMWLETTALGAIARETWYGFQILVGIHILGLVLSAGTLLWVDLRMIGICLTSERVSAIHRSLAPWFLTGFCVMFLSGSAIFAGFATSAYENTAFRIKLAALALAGVNALVFHLMVRRMSDDSDAAARPPRWVRTTGLASIALWATVVLCGRMMSYTMF